MNLNAKYDVFISYSRKDYVDKVGNPLEGNAISELLDFLDKNNVTYWFDKDGISGGSEFLEVITDAITDSKMMVFVSSQHSNASFWTTGEIFEALEQEMLIVPFKIDNSEYNKKFRLMMRPLDFIEYFANPEIAFDSLLKAINLCNEEYDKAVAEEVRREEEEKAKQRKAELLEEISTESAEYMHHVSMLTADAQKIVDKQKLVGNKEKRCPVCSTLLPIERPFCKKCGWAFNPVFDATPSGETNHLFVMRSLWKVVQDADAVRVTYEKKAQELETTVKEKERELESRYSVKDTEIEAIIKDKNEEIKALQSKLKECEGECNKLSAKLRDYEKEELRDLQNRDADKVHETIRKEKNKKGCKVFSVGDVTFKMIRVAGGSFTMGATPEMLDPWDSEKPVHKVNLDSYYMGETTVTQALWKAVMGCNPSYFKDDSFPVERVSWDDCQKFIKKLNNMTGRTFRLPTEAEWEFAARGGVNGSMTQYSGSDRLDDVAWFDGNSGGSTHSVKSKASNELGLYDMTGNVWEWCQDWYGNYSSDEQTNPTGPDTGTHRVDRGGSKYNDVKGCRLSYRGASSPNYHGDDLGFRLALSE